jgi:hypothetical protein
MHQKVTVATLIQVGQEQLQSPKLTSLQWSRRNHILFNKPTAISPWEYQRLSTIRWVTPSMITHMMISTSQKFT